MPCTMQPKGRKCPLGNTDKIDSIFVPLSVNASRKRIFLNRAPVLVSPLADHFLRENVIVLPARKGVSWIRKTRFSPSAVRATIARHDIPDREQRESRDGQMSAFAGAFFSK